MRKKRKESRTGTAKGGDLWLPGQPQRMARRSFWLILALGTTTFAIGCFLLFQLFQGFEDSIATMQATTKEFAGAVQAEETDFSWTIEKDPGPHPLHIISLILLLTTALLCFMHLNIRSSRAFTLVLMLFPVIIFSSFFMLMVLPIASKATPATLMNSIPGVVSTTHIYTGVSPAETLLVVYTEDENIYKVSYTYKDSVYHMNIPPELLTELNGDSLEKA